MKPRSLIERLNEAREQASAQSRERPADVAAKMEARMNRADALPPGKGGTLTLAHVKPGPHLTPE
jgi:hypothetical protein